MYDFKHLKDEIYYTDFYDKLTIEKCRRLEASFFNTDFSKYKEDKVSEQELKRTLLAAHRLMLYFETGEQYRHKAQTIREWMDRDRERDLKVETAQAPRGVRCLKCGSAMFIENKHLDFTKDKERVFFFFACPSKCLPMRAFFDDGEEYRPKPRLCPKCKGETTSSDEKVGNVIKVNHTCVDCGNMETDTYGMAEEKKEKPDENYEKDRQRFCLTKEAGEKYLTDHIAFEQMAKIVDKWKEKDKNKELYDAVAKIKKLPIGEVQKLLNEVFENESYGSLQFQQPQIDKFVIVPFTAIDNKAGRIERESQLNLKKLITEVLADTNWRLMSDGITYRVGYVSGRIRCYENEEDLLELINQKKTQHK